MFLLFRWKYMYKHVHLQHNNTWIWYRMSWGGAAESYASMYTNSITSPRKPSSLDSIQSYTLSRIHMITTRPLQLCACTRSYLISDHRWNLTLPFPLVILYFTLAIALRGGRVAYMSGGSFKVDVRSVGYYCKLSTKLSLVLDAPWLFNQHTHSLP